MVWCPSVSQVAKAFSDWQLDSSSSVEAGLDCLRTGLALPHLSFHLYSTETHQIQVQYPVTDGEDTVAGRIDETCPPLGWHANEKTANKISYTAKLSDIYVTSFSIVLPEGNDLGDLTEGIKTIFEMAAPALIQKHLTENRVTPDPIILQEALDAIDDGFIVYDSNEQIVAYNSKQKDLFPSVGKHIELGATYTALLNLQKKAGHLDAAKKDGEKWIKKRQQQLKMHRHQEEQKFLDGRTIRLTHYVTDTDKTVAVRSDITELVEEREKAVQNELLFRSLIENAPIPLIISADNQCIYANSHAHDLFKAKQTPLIGMDIFDFYVQKEDRESLFELLNNGMTKVTRKIDLKTLDGDILTVNCSSAYVNYQGKNAIISSLLDITETDKTRQALKQSEKQNRDLLELVPDALIVQVNGITQYVNDSAVQIFGASSKSEMIGSDSLVILDDEEREKVINLRNSALRGEKQPFIETRHKRANGEVFQTEMHSKAVIWNGKLGTMNIIKDVSKRRQYETSLIQKEKEMALAQEIGHFGHWRVKMSDFSVFWSDELFRIHGLDPNNDTLTIERAISLVLKEDRGAMRSAIMKTAQTEQVHEFQTRIHLEDGSIRVMAGSMRPEYDEKGNVDSVFGVSQDITETLALESRLRQSQKMEAVGQLTGGVAHDFNNLLAVIQGNAELLLESSESLSEQLVSQLTAILRASERGAKLTKSMLAFSRKQELRPSITCLSQQVDSMVEMFARTIGEAISIHTSTSPDLGFCIADPGELENAVLNLVLNARDAMPAGGKLTIETGNKFLEEATASNGEHIKPGDYVYLSIADTGSGITKKNIQHVFEPFYTTKDVGKGTGLGLSMVYGFVKQSDGHITVDSEVGNGTTVTIFLPQTDRPQKDGDENVKSRDKTFA
ncbi:PAS domain S-box protein [Sneathiella sp.]|jgi:PAS domain S-box-containing protein|uniref:PAS domain S-box protein n=1 Tax=Sneathiella sp. TaxID=1964365 RepID=UPI0039E53D86